MHRKKTALIGGATVVAMGIIGVAGVAGSAGTVGNPMRQAGSVTAQSATTTAPAKATCGPPDSAPGFGVPAKSGVVPDVQCMDLQLAEDKAEAAGYTHLSSEDASGQGRHQWYDRNWVVISQTPAPGTKAAPGTQLVFRVLAYGDRGAPPVPNRTRPGPLPKLMCFDLQEAEDTLQSAGFTRMTSEDATGRGRHSIIDRDWTVTGQAPAPGGNYRKSTKVVLRAVKDGEPSPCT
jgi:beta-lactam-binding protein with PASTA domain